MALAHYKDLCIDASDAHALGAFWGELLGWEHHPHDDGDSCLREGERVHVWVNQVPEPTSVKNRLHLDVNVESLDVATSLGATVLDADSFAWNVMQDPDGQQFCAFVREDRVTTPAYELAWDVTGGLEEVRRLSDWWSAVLGGTGTHGDRWSWIEDIEDLPFDSIVFAPVPEAKVTKNRIHIDVTTDDVARLLDAGARLMRPKGDDGIGWHVLTDPAGNEFCAFTPD